MVNDPYLAARAAERALALSYATAERRASLATLFALDDRLRGIARAARDPTIGLMRLTWWRDALARLDTAPAPAEPLLRALAADVLPQGISGARLARLTDGWDALLTGDADRDEVARELGCLFTLAAQLLCVSDPRVEVVGAAWARVELARGWPDAGRADVAVREGAVLDGAYRRAWPRALRPLGALGLLARFDAEGRVAPGDPRRVARLLWHRLTGR